MRLLLDTHALVWATTRPSGLTASAAAVLADPSNDIYVSSITGWEVAMLWTKRRLRLAGPPDQFVRAAVTVLRARTLDLLLEHAMAAAVLPPHHQDPFDRFLIAQAQIEGLTLVSRDVAFRRYAVEVLW